MTRSNMPPQAYTAETLAKAYEWLKDQPPSIHEMADSADNLVGLYLKAKRNHQSRAQWNEPPSTEAFKSDLRHLAKNLRQFDNKEQERLKEEEGSTSPVHPQEPTQKPLTPSTLEAHLDAKTWESLSAVQSALNLSSPTEALRLLVSLGYDKAKPLLPKPSS